jgi:hypothetical protein
MLHFTQYCGGVAIEVTFNDDPIDAQEEFNIPSWMPRQRFSAQCAFRVLWRVVAVATGRSIDLVRNVVAMECAKHFGDEATLLNIALLAAKYDLKMPTTCPCSS